MFSERQHDSSSTSVLYAVSPPSQMHPTTVVLSERQGDGSVIIQAVYGRFYGYGDDDGGLQTCVDGGMCQGEVEKLGEDPC